MHPSVAPAVALWPPDDTEESVVGTPFHQGTIGNVRLGINEAAAAATMPGRPAPWQANSQGLILGLDRGSLSLAQDGPPDLVIEMLSEATWESDVDLERGKAWSYADAGVAEYLILDPGGAYLRGAQGRGWRLASGVYAPWEPDARGRWASDLGFSIGYDGPWAMVWGPDERQVPREGQVLHLLDEGVEQGRAAMRALLLRVLTSRLGPPPPAVADRIAAIGSLAELEAAAEAALQATDLRSFLSLLDPTG